MTDYNVQPTGGTNPLAMVGLILGIISILMVIMSCCFIPLISSFTGTIFAIAALILGSRAKKQITEQGRAQSQMKMANAAYILGLISGTLGLISVAIAIITRMVFAGPLIEQQFQDILDQLQNP